MKTIETTNFDPMMAWAMDWEMNEEIRRICTDLYSRETDECETEETD